MAPECLRGNQYCEQVRVRETQQHKHCCLKNQQQQSGNICEIFPRTCLTAATTLKHALLFSSSAHFLYFHSFVLLIQADVFSYGIILAEVISRIPADPDFMPRTQVHNISDNVTCSNLIRLFYLSFSNLVLILTSFISAVLTVRIYCGISLVAVVR